MAGFPLPELTTSLRDHLVGGLHIGHILGGDRLPSIREVARARGEDPRKVARAYRALEHEGLVEVRGRSGVYAAAQQEVGEGLLEETAEWLASVLLEAWRRRIDLAELPRVLRRFAAGSAARFALLDSCDDALEAFGHELRTEFGIALDVRRLKGDPGPPDDALGAAVAPAQALVTTIFCAGQVRELSARVKKPMIVVRVHPDAATRVQRQLARGSLTVVCVDPSFGERMRMQYGDHIRAPDQLRVVTADDRDALRALRATDAIMLTRAARKRLGRVRGRMVVPHSPTLSPTSALEIIRALVRANHGAAGQARPGRSLPPH